MTGCGRVELFLCGCSDRAGLGAGAAGDALIGIDDELAVAFGNSLNGAAGRASAAGKACIGNLISHGSTSIKVVKILYQLYVNKNSCYR